MAVTPRVVARYFPGSRAVQRKMLLRSASSPLLNCARALAEHGAGHLAVLSSPSSAAAAARQGAALMCRAMSEGDLAVPLVPAVKKDDGHGAPTPRSASSCASFSIVEGVEEEEEAEYDYDDDDVVTAGATAPVPLRRLLTSTGLDSSSASTLALVEQERGDSRAPADAHYRRMIDADPGNPLLLGNYARFLKEVERDAARAREYCERAILSNPADADALALYAALVWETTRDADRADDYYARAVQAAPDDCYVLGLYAGFLWDAEEEHDDESDTTQQLPPPPSWPFSGAAQPPSITAAS